MPDPKKPRIRASGLQRHCVYCRSLFRPNPRLGKRQKICGSTHCQKKYRASYQRKYRKVPENAQVEREYETERKMVRGSEFWNAYREAHPESTQRNRANSRLKKSLIRKGLQRKLDIVQLFVPIDQSEPLIEFGNYSPFLKWAICC